MARYFNYPRPPSVAERRAKAARETQKRLRKGEKLEPVILTGRQVATEFWAQKWCQSVERVIDKENRLSRARGLLRHHSVIDLKFGKNEIRGLVVGTRVYEVDIQLPKVTKKQRSNIQKICQSFNSLIDFTDIDRIPRSQLKKLCDPKHGLLLEQNRVEASCTCPDSWAIYCKHIVAVLLGTAIRLNAEPEILFRLRDVKVDFTTPQSSIENYLTSHIEKQRRIEDDELAAIFGVEFADFNTPELTAADLAATEFRPDEL